MTAKTCGLPRHVSNESLNDQITTALLRWGSSELRDLPWRRTSNAWYVFVSEVMLQQTSVARVLPKYEAFIERFPTPQSLAEASLGDALALWNGLGYPRRCRNLQASAQMIYARHGGEVPDTLEAMLALPGVGAYTARAVLSFAYRQDVAVVDTNVARIIARMTGVPLKARELQERADELLPMGLSWEWNQVMMDFGARICVARSPKCSECVVQDICVWRGGPDSPDPAPATAGTSKPQSRFEGSDRQARGRAMKAAIKNELSHADLVEAMQLEHDPARAQRLIESLLSDGLLKHDKGLFTLP